MQSYLVYCTKCTYPDNIVFRVRSLYCFNRKLHKIGTRKMFLKG